MFPELTMHMNIYILSCPFFIFWHLSFLPCYLRKTYLFFCSILNLKRWERERNNLNVLGQASWNQLSFPTIWKSPYWHRDFHIISLRRHLSLHFLSSSISAWDKTWFFIQLYSPFYSTFLTTHIGVIAVALESFFSIANVWCLSYAWSVGLAYKLNVMLA